jgi:hypothetical protein
MLGARNEVLQQLAVARNCRDSDGSVMAPATAEPRVMQRLLVLLYPKG